MFLCMRGGSARKGWQTLAWLRGRVMSQRLRGRCQTRRRTGTRRRARAGACAGPRSSCRQCQMTSTTLPRTRSLLGPGSPAWRRKQISRKNQTAHQTRAGMRPGRFARLVSPAEVLSRQMTACECRGARSCQHRVQGGASMDPGDMTQAGRAPWDMTRRGMAQWDMTRLRRGLVLPSTICLPHTSCQGSPRARRRGARCGTS